MQRAADIRTGAGQEEATAPLLSVEQVRSQRLAIEAGVPALHGVPLVSTPNLGQDSNETLVAPASLANDPGLAPFVDELTTPKAPQPEEVDQTGDAQKPWDVAGGVS